MIFESERGFEASWHRGCWEQSQIALTPEEMGLYQLLDAAGRVLYVGFAKDLRSVLLKHLRKGDIAGVEGFRWAEYRSVEEAQQTQNQLIDELGASYKE
jgi:excinuclease UvrABC nuclease subunit